MSLYRMHYVLAGGGQASHLSMEVESPSVRDAKLEVREREPRAVDIRVEVELLLCVCGHAHAVSEACGRCGCRSHARAQERLL